MTDTAARHARASTRRIASGVVVASCLLLAPSAHGAERPAATTSWTRIDLGDLAQFATRDATVGAAPDHGAGAIRVVAVEDRPAVFDYPELGRQPCDNCTFAYLRGITFDNGVIEVDISGERVAGEEPEQKGFSGLVFNIDPGLTTWESVYFRPHNAVDSRDASKAVQYVRMPGENWFILRGGKVAVRNGELVDVTDPATVDLEKGSKYESAAPGIAPGKWFTARLAIAGRRIAIFVRPEGAREFVRVLDVESFNGADVKGEFGFITEPRNRSYFRNARYRRMTSEEAASWLAAEPR